MKPAAVSFSPDIVNVAIVDNAATQPDSEGHITIDFNRRIEQNSASTDTAKIVFKESLVQFMNEENYFNKVELYPYNMRTDTDYERISLLTKEDIKEICKEMDADAAISLDVFMTSSDMVLGIGSGGFSMGYNELKGKIGLSYRIFDREGELIGSPLAQIDSVFWNNIDRYIPHRDDALKQLSLIAAEKAANLLIPYWEKQERWYFSDGTSGMKEGVQLAKEARWADAAVKWGDAFSIEEKPQKKAKLASNIALANECLDDVENALKWVNIAISYLPEQSKSDLLIMTVFYKAQLQKRMESVPKLKTQLGNE